jgi:hypothetical protein
MEGFLNVEGKWLKVMKKRFFVLDKINDSEIYLTSYLGPLKKIKKNEFQITTNCEIQIFNSNSNNKRKEKKFHFQIFNPDNKKYIFLASDNGDNRNAWIYALNKCYYISNNKIKMIDEINNNLSNLSNKIILLKPLIKTIANLFKVLINVKIFKFAAFEFYERIEIFCNCLIDLNESGWNDLFLEIQLLRLQTLLDQSIEIWNNYCDNFLLNAYLCDDVHIQICRIDKAITLIINNILSIFSINKKCDSKLEYLPEYNVSYLYLVLFYYFYIF